MQMDDIETLSIKVSHALKAAALPLHHKDPFDRMLIAQTQLEKIEDIEILRFLEMGKKIKMIKMSNKSISIDTKKDLKKANSNSIISK